MIRKHLSKPNLMKPWLSRSILDLLMILIGSLFAALAVNVFYLPLRLTMGGLSGVASIVYQLTGQGSFLSMGLIFLLLNIPVFLLGWRIIGLHFVWRSLVGSVSYSLMLDITRAGMSDWFASYINRPLGGSEADPMIYCIFGGVFYGIGLGLVFRRGYTTGGTDILAVAAKRKWDILSVGQFVLAFDSAVVLASTIAYANSSGPAILLAMYSFIAMFLTSKSMDLVIEGLDFSKMAYIISNDSQTIADRIIHDLHRGVTLLPGKGMYTGQNRDTLLCVLPRKQLPDLKRIVQNVDKDAFVIVSEAREVLGEGFGEANKS